jgi:hypothetical protein
MPKLDSFTRRRLEKFVEQFRANQAKLPVLADFEKSGFSKEQVDRGVKEKLLGEFYVTLTNGSIVKGYNVIAD